MAKLFSKMKSRAIHLGQGGHRVHGILLLECTALMLL
ncbi:hypothetical protein DAI22_05g027032 [Oryza sativa Japonica Group]|nr:hypothetical protein DAI22_05g027032 [Oryza sativa Japonica Group]